MNGIKSRINDAIFLWDNERKESAFLLAVVSVAALSKQRYPYDKDGDAFGKTFQDFRKIGTSIEFRGQQVPIETIFYKWIRCNLVHEGELPFDIEFLIDTEPNTMSIRAGGYPEYILKIGTGWFFHLINSLLESNELNNNSKK